MGTDKIMDDAKRVVEDEIEIGEEGLSEAKETVDKFWNRAKKASAQVEDTVVEYGRESWNAFRKYSQKNPGQTVLIALGIGVLIGGFLFSGGSREE